MKKEKEVDIEAKREREKIMVSEMIDLYCRKKHKTKKGHICKDCQELKDYALFRTEKCPFMKTKTFCSQCKVHCYSPAMREKIKDVMRFAGPRIFPYHPIITLRHVHDSLKAKKLKEKEEKQKKIQETQNKDK